MRREMTATFIIMSVFLVVRILALLVPLRPIPFMIYPDAYNSYVPAGLAYITGASINSTNPEHPPLAKYIIGFFAAYAHNANIGSLLFGFISVVVVMLLSGRLFLDKERRLAVVCLLAFDGINVSISVDPMLEVFMLFFGLLGLYLLSELEPRIRNYLLGGLCLGFSLASKWTALFIVLPVLLFLILRKKYAGVMLALAASSFAYLLPFVPFIMVNGFSGLLNDQMFMLRFMFAMHASTSADAVTFFNRAAMFLILSSGAPPSSSLFPIVARAPNLFLTLNYAVNPVIAILTLPMFVLQTRKYLDDRVRFRGLLLLVAVSLLGWQMLLAEPFETWFWAPINVLTCIFAVDYFVDFQTHGIRRWATYGLMAGVAAWPLLVILSISI
jgi:4-amino-4-deoxy-L-arabinose transferase-like glycosyltransferase